MVWLMLAFVYYVLSYSTVHVAGKCTVSSCEVSLSGSEESIQVSLEEHDHRLETMNQNMCSAFEKLEAAVNRTNVRGQGELCKSLKTLYHNMSVNLEKVSGKIPVRAECPAMQELEEYLNSMNLSLAAMNARTDERIQAVSESLDQKFREMKSAIQTASRSLDAKFQVMNGSFVGVLGELDVKFQTLSKTIFSAIVEITEKLNASLDHVKERHQSVEPQDNLDPCRNTSVVCDCSDIKANGYTTSGVYRIYVVDKGERYYANASCDMTATKGAWTIFQRRKDGSVDFFRNWNAYEYGFGNPNGEFWLGNNILHLLTSERRYRLRIDLEDFEGEKRYAEYSTFNINSPADKYRLRLGSYSGTAGDGLSPHHNGYQFSTKETGSCAAARRGGWWYNYCATANLNGLYLRGRYSSGGSYDGFEGIQWEHFHFQWYSLKKTEMKISSS